MAAAVRRPSSVGLLAAALGLATAAVYLLTVAPGGIDSDDRAPTAIYGVAALACALLAAVGSTWLANLGRRLVIGMAAIGFLGLGLYAVGTIGMPIFVAGLAAAAASVHASDPDSDLA
jgi:hypothetical protein